MSTRKLDSSVHSITLNLRTGHTILSSNSNSIITYSFTPVRYRARISLAWRLRHLVVHQFPPPNGLQTRHSLIVGSHFCGNHLRTRNFKSSKSHTKLPIQENHIIIRFTRQKSYLYVGIFGSIILWAPNEIPIRSAIYWPVIPNHWSQVWSH